MFPKVRQYDFNYRIPPVADGLATIDDIKRISPFFTESSPITYAVFLEANKTKLSQDEFQKTQNLIRHLTEKENETYKAVASYLKTREEYENTMIQIEETLDKTT